MFFHFPSVCEVYHHGLQGVPVQQGNCPYCCSSSMSPERNILFATQYYCQNNTFQNMHVIFISLFSFFGSKGCQHGFQVVGMPGKKKLTLSNITFCDNLAVHACPSTPSLPLAFCKFLEMTIDENCI